MRTVPRWALLPALAAPVLVAGGWTWAAHGVPGFDSTRGTISDLTIAGMPHRTFLSVALVLVGLCYLAVAAALRPAFWAGRLVLAVGGLATVVVAAYPDPTPGGPAIPQHSRYAGVQVVALTLWPLLAARRRPPSRVLSLPVAVAALAVLTAELLWFDHLLGHKEQHEGLWERVLVLSQALWVAAVVVRLRQAGSPPANRGTDRER